MYVRDNYEVESLSKIQNMFIYICYQALYKFYESTIKKKRIEVHKLLIRLNQDNSDEKLERLLFDWDPCEMNMRLIHNNIFRFPDGSLSKEHIEVLDSLLDNENDSFLLCDFLVPKTQGKPECYPLPFIYPRYVLKFKGRRQ